MYFDLLLFLVYVRSNIYVHAIVLYQMDWRIILTQATLWTLEWTLGLDEEWGMSWTVTELMTSQERLCPLDVAKANNMFLILNKALIYWGCIYEFIAIFRIEKWTKVNKSYHCMKWKYKLFIANATKLYIRYKLLNDSIKNVFLVLLFFIVLLILWSNKNITFLSFYYFLIDFILDLNSIRYTITQSLQLYTNKITQCWTL